MYFAKSDVYEVMKKRLEDYYDDESATRQAALEDLLRPDPSSESAYGGQIEFVVAVEFSYSQVEELNQVNALLMRDVDFVNGLLPNLVRTEWNGKYHDMSSQRRLNLSNPLLSSWS